MKQINYKPAAAIVLAGIWVNASEFFRNEILVKGLWVAHYASLGMIFPSAPLNGIIWMVWGFGLAAVIYLVSRKFSLVQTGINCWLPAFALMWVAIWNLKVLPAAILVYAVPLSLLEVFAGTWICLKIAPPEIKQ